VYFCRVKPAPFALLLLFFGGFLSAQTPTVFDSLETVLPTLLDTLAYRTYKRMNQVCADQQNPANAMAMAERLRAYAAARQDTLFLRYSYELLEAICTKSGNNIKSAEWKSQRMTVGNQYGFSVDELYEAGTNVNISSELAILEDATGTMTFEQVRFAAFGLNETEKNGIDPEKTYWVRLKIRGSTYENSRYYFAVGGVKKSWQQIDFYQPVGRDIHARPSDWTVQRSGLALRPSEKTIRDAYNMFYVDLPQGSIQTVYLRLHKTFPGADWTPAQIQLRFTDVYNIPDFAGYRPHLSSFQETFIPFYAAAYMGRSIEFVEDTNSNTTIEQIATQWDKACKYQSFIPPNQKKYWAKMRLIGGKKTQRVLLDLSPMEQIWSKMDIYFRQKTIDAKGLKQLGTWEHQKTGAEVPNDEKTVRHQYDLIELELEAGDTLDFYVRMERGIFPKMIPSYYFAHLDDRVFWQQQAEINFVAGAVQVLLGFLTLFFLVLGLATHERVYLNFSLLPLGALLFSIQSFYNPFINPPNVSIGALIRVPGLTLVAHGMLYYAVSFLDLHKIRPGFWRLNKILCIILWILTLLICGAALALVQDNTQALFYAIVLIAYLLAIIFALLLPIFYGIYAWRKGLKTAKFFLLVNSVFTIGGSISFLSLILQTIIWQTTGAGNDAGSTFTNYIMLVCIGAFFISLLLFAVGIGYRTNILKKEKERALQESLAAQQSVNERLRAVDKLKDQFLANTSHELRTPLQGIIGLSDSLYEEESDQEKRDNLGMISASGRRLNNLVNDLLDFSKLRNQEIALNLQPVSLYALADVVLRNMAPLIKGKNLVLENNVSAELPAVTGDEDRLQQILFNLVGNAVKFTEKGKITLDAILQEGFLKMTIEDTGIGIAPENREIVFKEFEQSDGSNERAFGGTGLGLPITKRLVELHGGTIGFESELHKGTAFYFTLPLAKGALVAIGGGPTLPGGPQTIAERIQPAFRTGGTIAPVALFGEELLPEESSQGRILVVDDEPVNQQVLKNYLSKQQYQVVQVMNGEDALIAIEQQGPFDLVLLDVMMPRMSGYELCQKIRERFLPSELPVIMITAKNQVSDLVEGLNTGANDYLTKPFSKDEFLARLKTHLNLHKINVAAGRFVPYAFIRALGRDSITEVQLGDHVEKEVTVLFADIRDYTPLAEAMTPEENFKFVQSFNQRMGPIIQQYGGFVNQYLGDGLMAIFTNGAESALLAAIGMHRELDHYNERRTARGRRPIAAGFGLHTGPLIMGIIGDRKRMDATTVADTVNVASRMEGITKYYGADILLSEFSLSKIENTKNFNVRYLGKVQVKGKQEPTGVYECFDGDLPDLRKKKQQTRAVFEQALHDYCNQSFEQARLGLSGLLSNCPQDKTAAILLHKIEHCLATGVPEGWTGVETMFIK